MVERLKAFFEPARRYFQGEGRGALIALAKAAALLGSLSEAGWQLHVHYFSKYFPQLPLSIAWSMLMMIFFIVLGQLTASMVLKLGGARRAKLREAAVEHTARLIAAYLNGADCHGALEHAAADSPRAFEECVAAALLRLHGSSLSRLCDLPDVIALRQRWIAASRSGDDAARRRAVEHLSLLRDAAAIEALEGATDDRSAQVAASAVRGLLRMPGYARRDQLAQSLIEKPYLVRVLTACENRSLAERESPADPLRAAMLELAAKGRAGQKVVRKLSAKGKAGDAPAEALGAVLTSAVRGGAS